MYYLGHCNNRTQNNVNTSICNIVEYTAYIQYILHLYNTKLYYIQYIYSTATVSYRK